MNQQGPRSDSQEEPEMADAQIVEMLAGMNATADMMVVQRTRRAVMQAAGVSNILTKSIGTSNPHNVIKATFEGLRNLKDPQEVSRLREKPLEEILG